LSLHVDAAVVVHEVRKPGRKSRPDQQIQMLRLKQRCQIGLYLLPPREVVSRASTKIT
jgi:hypothetical protein